ncbi:Signal recognition particle, SRP19 subunit [Paramicrosporidium saccamoebae]|uniref:Signal recognition particle, SRP19 subunit n=1 Tax=Paramicrosporidium saccamoebae TaxID=1246581 RepID=A0A2H9TPJ6_9FUNG|nr:Signal recognition particle, SRP19 subunit [Paramicrosporidium saccamoebae]
MSEDCSRWNCLYPLYFDKARSLADGRRVKKEEAIEKPTVQHLAFACESLGVPFSVEAMKRHPRDPLLMGRVRVHLTDANICNTRVLIRQIASCLPEIASKMPSKDLKEVQGRNSPSAESSGVTLVPRIKKRGKKK